MNFKVKRNLKVVLLVFIGMLLALFAVIMSVPVPEREDWDYSTVVRDINGELLRVYLNNNEQWHLEYNKKEIPEKLKKAILVYEDNYFYSHRGVNPVALFKAFILNIKKGKVISGGSTITMQVARIYGNNPRKLRYKFLETLQALKLEILYTKDEILLTYLNNAPYGGNIIGIESAAYKYFNKDVSQLTWAEASLFAVLPNNPGYLYPGANTELLKNKRDRLLRQLHKRGILTENQLKFSYLEPINTYLHRFPAFAPHLSDYLKRIKSEEEINTTLDKNLQIEVDREIVNYSKELQNIGIKNISLLLTDTESGEVRAYIGSQDYFDKENNGYVDGVRALRSSGSILKPFIYGYALERGLVTERSLLEDVISSYGIVLPKNFDHQYLGVVSVREALAKSLNIPAYHITHNIGVHNAVNTLKSVGMSSLSRSPEEYGLSICIGGAEVSLWDLTKMYQSLAHYGEVRDIKVLKDEKSDDTIVRSLLSPATNYTILNILNDVKRPNNGKGSNQKKKPNFFSWKSGTSNGYRDAWAVGVNKKWTIAVWCGNFTGEGNPSLTGVSTAGRLMFRVLSILPDRGEKLFAKPLDSFKNIPVCAVTGYTPTKNCKDILWIDIPKSAFVLPKCPYHKSIIVSEDEEYELCSECWGDSKTKKISVLDYPTSVDAILKERFNVVTQTPKHNPQCITIPEVNSIEFEYPKSGSTIMLPRDYSGKTNSFQAVVHIEFPQERLFWFLDQNQIGETVSEHKLDIKTDNGEHKLMVCDKDGNSKSVTFTLITRD